MPGQMIRDAELPDVVRAAGRGEPWALAQLFRAYQPRLLRYLRAHEPGVADDLASEVWICAARGLSQFTGGEAAFRAWLYTIARRRLIDHRRKVARRRTDVMAADRFELVVGLVSWDDPARTVVDRLGAKGAIDELIAQLTPEQAEAVLLRVVGGLPVAEVARIMQRPPGTVRVLCHRALRRLAGQLGGVRSR